MTMILGTSMLATGETTTTPTPAPPPTPPAYSPVIVPHLALPLVVGPTGSFNVNDQNTDVEVAQCVRVLLGTQEGERTMVPGFGIIDPTFIGPDLAELNLAIAQWEPRAQAEVTIGQNVNGTVAVDVKVSSIVPGA